MLPKARSENLVVEEVGSETVVYDLETNKAHRLNPAAAGIWRRCNGRREVAQLAPELSEEAILLALRQLEAARLIAGDFPRVERISRRELSKRIGIAVAALPVITSLIAPTAAAAASCTPAGAVCGTQSAGNCTVSVACCPGGRCIPAAGGKSFCTCQ